MNTWIKHDGGPCPVPSGTPVEAKFPALLARLVQHIHGINQLEDA